MKIINKISLRRGLHRIVQPTLAYPRTSRYKYFIMAPYKLTPSQELHKYSIKPKYFQFKWLLVMVLGGLGGLFWKAYQQEMYTNELDTIYRYRFHEEEVGSMKIYMRLFFTQLILWLEENWWISALFKKQTMGSQDMDYFAECILRYGQYKNYMKNKDRKFDFLDIGVLQKFPYPKKQVEPGME